MPHMQPNHRRFLRIPATFPARHWALLAFVIPLLIRAFWRIHLQDTAPATVIDPADPDPWVRLTLVRDLLRGGGWYSHLLAHSNAPFGGISSAWTRPLDVVIAALVALHPGEAPLNLKLMHVAALLPALWTALLLLGLFRSVRRYCDVPFAYFFAGGLSFAMIGARNYLGEGNADHHAPLTVLWAWVVSYMLQPSPTRRDMAIMGALLGLMLWINPEGLLLILATYTIFGVRWIVDGTNIRHLADLTGAVALTGIAAVMIEYPPAQWLTPIYDSISVVYALFVALLALAAQIIARIPLSSRGARILVAGIAAAAALIVMHATYPLFFAGPFVLMDPYVTAVFIPQISEAKSLLQSPPGVQFAQLLCPAIAILYLLLNLRRARTLLPPATAAALLFLILFTGAMFIAHVRWFYYCYPPVLLAITFFFTSIFLPDHPKLAPYWPSRAMATLPEITQSFLRVGGILLLLAVPPGSAYLGMRATHNATKNRDACEDDMRRWIHGGALQQALGERPLILLAPTNIGGSLLFFTHYRIIASNYHRDGRAIQYVWDAVKVPNASAMRSYLRARQVDALLICHDDAFSGASFLNDLYRGAPAPIWINRVSMPPAATENAAPQLWRLSTATKSN